MKNIFIATLLTFVQIYSYNIKKYGFEEYTDEIHKYILEGIAPTSDAVLALTT